MKGPLVLLLLLALLLGSGVWGQSLPPIRIGDQPGFARVVLDLPKNTPYTIEPLGAALRVTLPGQTLTPGLHFVSLPELAGYVLEQHEDKAVLILLTPQGVTPRSGYKTMTLAALEGDGQRLVIDLSGAFVDTSPLSSPPGFRFIKAQGRRFSVVLDAGHGGPDPGAMGPVAEKWVNLEVALRVRRLLQEAGVEVTLTRESDTAFSPDKRTDLTQRIALAEGKQIFVSIHANATVPARADGWCGLEVYYFGPTGARPFFPPPAPLTPPPVAVTPSPLDILAAATQPGTLDPGAQPSPEDVNPIPPQSLPSPTPQMNSARRMELSRTLAARVLSYMLGATAAVNRGVRSADFFVIRYASVPAILVEMGYLSHPIEGQNLRDANYLDRISYGIARGVLEYLENDHPLE
ncbi:MAG: N-acetylmuramoyl-L-alanine amidase [Meiothermus sp.]|uniref:N-acetylmuramoyl-L-alanine amidase family protein n=1 Tax=Meiothermus sp. TaxID=1955249 RepID=UPI0025DE9BE4|nr:N-acetylmuramoyl-L-alanine amidase [Meiothermus sp.]MCS7067781.1 N-acetylmuramoyl-L-alanine amidase [Meiothermus sp.]MDW8426598.1 N-acetylmuramoyl-L-alanine amidase [Meiothermus sp.]